MANRAEDSFVTLDDTRETTWILISIATMFFKIPEHASKYDKICTRTYKWTWMDRKPGIQKIAAQLTLIKELADDLVFFQEKEQWKVKIHREIYEDVTGIEDIPTDWTVYSGENPKAGQQIERPTLSDHSTVNSNSDDAMQPRNTVKDIDTNDLRKFQPDTLDRTVMTNSKRFTNLQEN